MVPFTEMGSGGAEVWKQGGRNGGAGGKEGKSEGGSGQPVSPQDAQNLSRTPVHWVGVQRLGPVSAFSHL